MLYPKGDIRLCSPAAKSQIFETKFPNLCRFVVLPFFTLKSVVQGESRSLKKKKKVKEQINNM